MTHEALEKREDFEELLSKIVVTLSDSDVGLTTTQIAKNVYGTAGVYPIILVTGMLGCLTAMGTVDFMRAGRARVWTLTDEQAAMKFIKR
jgi:hypothetical protein